MRDNWAISEDMSDLAFLNVPQEFEFDYHGPNSASRDSGREAITLVNREAQKLRDMKELSTPQVFFLG